MKMQTQRTDLWTRAERKGEGAGGMNGERNMEPYALPGVKYRQSMVICYMTRGTQTGAL